VRALDLVTGKEVRRFRGPGTYVNFLALTRDGKKLGAVNYYGQPLVWDTATGQERLRWKPSTAGGFLTTRLAFSPAGKGLGVGPGPDGLIRPWELAAGKEPHTLVNSDAVSCLAFSPDGRTLAVNDAGKAIRLWDVRLGKRAHQTGEHEGPAHALAF